MTMGSKTILMSITFLLTMVVVIYKCDKMEPKEDKDLANLGLDVQTDSDSSVTLEEFCICTSPRTDSQQENLIPVPDAILGPSTSEPGPMERRITDSSNSTSNATTAETTTDSNYSSTFEELFICTFPRTDSQPGCFLPVSDAIHGSSTPEHNAMTNSINFTSIEIPQSLNNFTEDMEVLDITPTFVRTIEQMPLPSPTSSSENILMEPSSTSSWFPVEWVYSAYTLVHQICHFVRRNKRSIAVVYVVGSCLAYMYGMNIFGKKPKNP